jgi:hypothetical protein
MLFTFLVCLAGMALLWMLLVRFELAAKSASASLARLRRALEGDPYVSAPTRSRIAPGLPSRTASANWMNDPTAPPG